MEGVGARLGRSSSRYGTTTVFNGPVRKWKKDWVPITPPSSSSNHSHKNHHHHHHHNNNNHQHHQGASSNGSDGNSVSHLRLFKWTPLNKDNISNGKIVKKDDDDDEDLLANGSKDLANQEELPVRKKFKYIPIAVLEEQKKETEENSDDDEAKPADSDEHAREQPSKSDGNDEKPDINDVPMEDNEADEENQSAPARQDLNELDLSLGFTSHDEEQDSDSKTDTNKDV